jgi:hypothetical protein
VTADLGPSFELLPYPLSALLDDGFMDAQLCYDDPRHGKDKYGASVLAQIYALLEVSDPQPQWAP